ncbi:hypothetical protein A5721_32960 [Mycobacterium vulneris]|nr:hypothetical protein A5721_32960 [Mycolicibacterium vulneris]
MTLLCGTATGVLSSCTTGEIVAGAPAAPQPYRGTVSVELVYTDSFDVLPAGRCRGRGNFQGVEDGADVSVWPMGGSDTSVKTVMSVRYEDDTARRRGADGDGRYCVARFSFVTSAAPLAGYRAVLDTSGPLSPLLVDFTPGPDGVYRTVMQACADGDAPPEKPCGFK